LIAKSPEITFSLGSWQMFLFQTKRRSWHCCKQYSAQRNSWTQPSLKHQVLLSHFFPLLTFALLKALWYCVVCLSLSIASKNSILCLLLGDGWVVCHNITPGTQETSEKKCKFCLHHPSFRLHKFPTCFPFVFFLTWNIIQTSKTDSVTSPKCLVNTSGLLTLQTPPKNWQILKGQMSKTKGIFTWPAHDLRPLAGAKQGGRYLQWRVSSTFIYKPVLGGGFPWHKLDVYSFYRWGFFNF